MGSPVPRFDSRNGWGWCLATRLDPKSSPLIQLPAFAVEFTFAQPPSQTTCADRQIKSANSFCCSRLIFNNGSGLGSHFLITLFHGGPARKFYAAFFVHAEAFDGNLVAFLDDVLSFFDAEVRQFADVNQAVLSGEEFNKCTEFLHGDHPALVDFANLRFSRHAGDGVPGDLHAFRRYGEDVHGA